MLPLLGIVHHKINMPPSLRDTWDGSPTQRANIIYIPSMSYDLISALETATTKIVQHATIQPYDIFSINISLPTREPGALAPSNGAGYNGLDDIKILPLWRQFVEAIKLSDPEDQFWYFEKVKMSTALTNFLQSIMKSRKIHTLKFASNYNADQDRINRGLMCEVLESNTNIKRLVNQGGRFNGRFYRAVKNSPSLEELHIKTNAIRNSNGLLSNILKTSSI